jgi:hypothetical protein
MAHRPGYRVDLGALTAARWRAPEAEEGPIMTVLIYVNTSKQVGDPDHLKVFANIDAAETWFAKHDPEGVAFEYDVIEAD